MTRRPTLSVAMCNYNHGRFLERSLGAIVSQSRPPDEFVIVDDASTDDSLEVIERYAKRHSYIRVVRNETNRGALGAMNQMWSLSTGDWVYGAAADDEVEAGALAALMDLVERHPEAGIAFGRMDIVLGEGRVDSVGVDAWDTARFVSPDVFVHEYLQREDPRHSLCGATIYRRSALEAIGRFRPELDHWADTFAARALGLRFGACYAPRTIMRWHRLDSGVAGSAARDPKGMIDVIERAAWLMRSEGFREIFPAWHVEDWVKRYRSTVIRQAYRERIAELSDDATSSDGAARSGWMRFLPVTLQKRWAKLLLTPWRTRLRLYRGDLSCYERAREVGSASQA